MNYQATRPKKDTGNISQLSCIVLTLIVINQLSHGKEIVTILRHTLVILRVMGVNYLLFEILIDSIGIALDLEIPLRCLLNYFASLS